MIQTLSEKFKRPIAYILAMVFYLQFILSFYAAAENHSYNPYAINETAFAKVKSLKAAGTLQPEAVGIFNAIAGKSNKAGLRSRAPKKIGGPSQPEATSFKQVGADNLVNLFTGDFSYSIPLLDVDGYPVNLFYNGGITMEQEATWVGLGWNINPGSISRNMRGIPDDFDGTDTLVQIQNVKPNKTWGGEIGADGELLGIKKPDLNFNVGFSYNNYLGPELDIGAGISVSIPLSKTVGFEKGAILDSSQGLNTSLGLNAKLSSRSGLTLAPSLNAGLQLADKRSGLGIGLSTSYNSRTGIKDLTINSQMRVFQSQAQSKRYLGLASDGFATDISNTTISFARPSYIPTLRMPMQYENYSGQVELGAGMFGLRAAGTAQGYYSVSKVADGSTKLYKPLFGYMYLEKANGHKDAVMDFNRLNDGEVTPNTPVVSVPQYDYDVFTIQGEGTGGSIRAYRSDIGFMHDPEITSKDKNFSIGFDIAPPGHYGGNWNVISTPTRSGNWDDINNMLNQTLVYKTSQSNKSFEHVYFRNPGEATVTNDGMINKMGRDNPVRFKIGGPSSSPWLESQLEQFSKKGNGFIGIKPFTNPNNPTDESRDKRTQVTTMLTAADAMKIGLDLSLHNYNAALDNNNNLQYTSIARVGKYRKANHISEITVLEGFGMRYVYGLPVYSIIQRDYTFSTDAAGNQQTNLVTFNQKDTLTTSDNANIYGNTGIDGYVSIQETPAYASSFLLTGLLSSDYVDVTGNGITEDDLGTAVKFNYTMSSVTHKWRTPRSSTINSAYFNDGIRTEKRDNKATISYGEREAWYLHSIESKSMIAVFKTSNRSDATGVYNLNGTVNASENANKKLDSIMLYSKADLKANGFAGALPLKTVHFEYSYALCIGTPDNKNSTGKLTLKDIYFTYNGQSRASENMYVFGYTSDRDPGYDNPDYAASASDRWGTYKSLKDSADHSVNPNELNNIDYPYTSSTDKKIDDAFAGAWSLKKILLPSGGQIEVSYEADDYAYVQNRRACDLFKIYGLGNSTDYAQNNMLYTVYGNIDQNYIYVQLPSALQNTDPQKIKQEIYAKYLDGMKQLAFKLNINMPKGMEPLTVYAGYDDYGLCTNSADRKMIYLKLTTIDGKGPLANAAIHYLIDNLPGQAFPGYDLSDDTGIEAFLDLIGSELSGLTNSFKNAENQVRSDGKASSVSLANSFVRLADPDFTKYGGGHRVKRIILKDNWDAISGQYTSQYGQDYDYTTTAMVNGIPATISSGVASYEPGIGSEENPFREILQFENKLPLASAQYGAIEMPILEAFYPAPVVGYSKVTVRSINRNGTHGDSIVRSAIGKQVTEFYTAKDYPVYATYTPMNSVDYHHNPPFTFFNKETIDKRIISQGFLVETNDMHGKIKSQAAYSESDQNTPLSYTLHVYKNTGANGMNDLVNFVHNDQNGAVTSGNIGVDMELMTDVRQFNVRSNGSNGQAQVDFFSFFPFPTFGVFVYPLQSYTENDYKAVTTTKLINYHAIEDSIIVNDKGSTVTTKNVLYDAETGSVVVNSTINEYNKPVYTTSFPAYWAYSGMGPAYQNINIIDSNITFSNGQITTSGIDKSLFESGDELYIYNQSDPTSGCDVTLKSPDVYRIWAYDTTKNTSSLTQNAPYLIFIDSSGRPFTKNGVNVRVIRSGKRNLLDARTQQIVSMANPVRISGSTLKLIIDNSTQAVSASAMEYQEKWQVDKGVIGTFTTVINGCTAIETPDCNGNHLEKTINPYRKGLLGTFRAYKNMVYYGDRAQTDPTINTNIATNGLLTGFNPYWSFNSSSNLIPATANAKWVWNTKSNRFNARGLELETQNALNIYSAAQYGYKNSLPVAITNNAAYGESMFDGFEDYNYAASLNNSESSDCNNTRYTDLSGLGQIFIPDDLEFYAHTGKYVLMIPKNSTASKQLNLSASTNIGFTMRLAKDSTLSLTNQGGNFSINPSKGNIIYWADPTSYFGTSSQQIDIYPSYSKPNHYCSFNTDTYLQILQPGDYNFNLSLGVAYNNDFNSLKNSGYFNQMSLSIKNLDNATIKDMYVAWNQQTDSNHPDLGSTVYYPANYTVHLCKGIYHIVGSGSENYSASPTSDSHNQYSWSCPNCSSPDYINLTSSGGCYFTDPISGSESMLNPLFAPAPGKKMQFSAWVRQTTDNTGSAKIVFSDGSSVSLPKPNGISIEGWQKIEGPFTIPSGATSMTLQLTNSDANKTIYFDDIRIHPFNANMKSYVYDPRSLRLTAELDENNYASFYDYDEEGQLVRTKKETTEGIKTIQETRSAKQKAVKTIQ